MSFFNDDIPPFEGIDIGGEGQDPMLSAGDYQVVVDSPVEESQTHDFKISVAESSGGGTYDITVAAGRYHNTELHDDSSGDAKLGRFTVTHSETTFTGKAATSTWGIWMRVLGGSSSGSFPPRFQEVGEILVEHSSTVDIVADSTYTDTSHLGAFTASTANYTYIYIGKVVLASGVATITQRVKEAISIPVPLYMVELVSASAGNDITINSDGLFLALAVSGSGISRSGTGTVTFSNTGVHSIIAGVGISVDTATGDVTVTNDNP